MSILWPLTASYSYNLSWCQFCLYSLDQSQLLQQRRCALIKHHKLAHIAEWSQVNHCSFSFEGLEDVYTLWDGQGVEGRFSFACILEDFVLFKCWVVVVVQSGRWMTDLRLSRYLTDCLSNISSPLSQSILLWVFYSSLFFYLCVTPYFWFVSTSKRHTLPLSGRLSAVVLTAWYWCELTCVGKRTDSWVLWVRYIIKRLAFANIL